MRQGAGGGGGGGGGEGGGGIADRAGIFSWLVRDVAAARNVLHFSVLESAREPERSIIRDFVEHAIPRESFTYAPLGMRRRRREVKLLAPKMHGRIAHSRPKLLLAGNERWTDAEHGSYARRALRIAVHIAALKIHFIFYKRCGEHRSDNVAALSMSKLHLGERMAASRNGSEAGCISSAMNASGNDRRSLLAPS